MPRQLARGHALTHPKRQGTINLGHYGGELFFKKSLAGTIYWAIIIKIAQ
jgi:hypothetical protein